MLTKKFSLLAVPFVALVGCGGDDGKAPPIVHDAPPVVVDTPPQATCSFAMTEMGGLNYTQANGDPVEDKANATDPNMKFSWYEVYQNTMDPNDPLNGRKQLSIAARLPVPPALPFNDDVEDVLIVNLFANAQGVFVINTATPFNTDATADTYNAETIIFGNVVGQNYQNFYYGSSGGITLMQVGENSGQNAGVTIGSVGATAYHELDDQGAEVATGCKPMLDGIDFKLKTLATANGKPGAAISGHDVESYRAMVQRAREQMAQKH